MQRLLPRRIVGLDVGAEPSIFPTIARQHRGETTLMLVDMSQRRLGAQPAVGHVQEVRRPASLRSICQVSRWEIESVVLPCNTR